MPQNSNDALNRHYDKLSREDREKQEYLESLREVSIDYQIALEASRESLEAGQELKAMPNSALGKEEAVKAYGEGLDQRETQARTNPNESQRQQELAEVAKYRQEHQAALIEAIYIREVVRREISDANLHYRNAEPGETYHGRVVGKSNSFVIQSDDRSPGSVVLHDRAAISGNVKMNEHAEISYPAGAAGIVRDRARAQPQRQMQRQHGMDRK